MGSQRSSRLMSLKYRWETGLKRGHVVGDKAGSRIRIHVSGTCLFVALITLFCLASVYQNQAGGFKDHKSRTLHHPPPPPHQRLGRLYYPLHHLLLLFHSHLFLLLSHVGGGTWYLAQGLLFLDNFIILSCHSHCWVPRTHCCQWFPWSLAALWERT